MECADILKQGIFNVVRFESYESSESHYYDWIMSVTESDARTATNFGLDMSIPVDGLLVPLKPNFSSDDWNTWSRKRERLVKSDVSRTLMVKAFSRTVDHKLVEAWSECMGAYYSTVAQKAGLSMDLSERRHNVIPVSIALNVPGAPVEAEVQSWDVSNAVVIGGRVPSKVVSNEPVLVTYRRVSPDEEVVISIQTSRGTLFKIIHPDVPIVPVKRQVGRDFGAVAETPVVQVTVDVDQSVRVWGGVIAAFEQWGDPSASAWLYRDVRDGPLEWASQPKVQMLLQPDGSQPYVTMFGSTYRGTLVGQFDFHVPVKAGETLKFVGYTENYHAKSMNYVLFIDYVELPDETLVTQFAATGTPLPLE